MGGNGSYYNGYLDHESERDYYSVRHISKNIVIIELKIPGTHNKMPRTSHTANRVYVTLRKDGSGISDISRYGENHQKKWSIHTATHQDKKGRVKIVGGHVHYWENGKPTGRIDRLSDHPNLVKLVEFIKNNI